MALTKIPGVLLKDGEIVATHLDATDQAAFVTKLQALWSNQARQVIVSSTDPGNVPDGTIWHKPGATSAGVKNPAFTNVSTFFNSWANTGGEWVVARYRKLEDGTVEVEATVSSGTASHIFTLPSGYRPGASILLAGSTNPDAYGQVKIDASGYVYAITYDATWLHFRGSFRAEN